jgi:hypothetical protein
MQELIFPVIGFIALIGAVTVSVIVVRIASVLIKRLEAFRPGVSLPDPAIGELREELDTMQERLDFLERAVLAENQSGRGLAAGARQS